MNNYFVQLDKLNYMPNDFNNYVNLSNIFKDSLVFRRGVGGANRTNDSSNPIIKKSENEEQKCAPSKKFEQNSCFTIEGLKEIATAFNTYVHMKIIKGKKVINISDNKSDLLKIIPMGI